MTPEEIAALVTAEVGRIALIDDEVQRVAEIAALADRLEDDKHRRTIPVGVLRRRVAEARKRVEERQARDRQTAGEGEVEEVWAEQRAASDEAWGRWTSGRVTYAIPAPWLVQVVVQRDQELPLPVLARVVPDEIVPAGPLLFPVDLDADGTLRLQVWDRWARSHEVYLPLWIVMRAAGAVDEGKDAPELRRLEEVVESIGAWPEAGGAGLYALFLRRILTEQDLRVRKPAPVVLAEDLMARIADAVDGAGEDDAWVDKDSAPGWWAIRTAVFERAAGRERGARRVLAEASRLKRGPDGAYSVVRRHNGKPVRVYVVLLDPGAEQAYRKAHELRVV